MERERKEVFVGELVGAVLAHEPGRLGVVVQHNSAKEYPCQICWLDTGAAYWYSEEEAILFMANLARMVEL